LHICTLVDGLPLGIELASAWVRTLSCRAIADSIGANLDSVHTERPDIPERHRSLRAAFNHSWELLAEDDRHALTRLSIFLHGFSAEAAHKLANITPARLAGFVDKSMLSSPLPGRHVMPETIRAFVVQLLQSDPDEYERLAEAHCEYYLTCLAGMLPVFASENGALAIKELELDMVNLRAALRWALDHRRWALASPAIDPLLTFFELQGRFREGLDDTRTLLEHLTSLVEVEKPGIYHTLLGWEGWFAFCSGFTQEGLEKLHKQLEYAQQQGDLAHVAYTDLLLANAYARLGDLGPALHRIEQSLATLDKLPAPDHPLILGIRSSALAVYGVILISLNRIEHARQVILQAEDALHRSGARYGLIRLCDAQARLANRDNQPQESYHLRQKALAIAEEFNDRRRIADLLNNLAQSAEKLGDFALAFDYCVRCLQLCNELGDRHLSAINHNNLGYLTLQLKRPASEAIPYYKKSLTIFREIDDNRGTFFTLRDIARAYLQAGNLDLARHSLQEALHLGHASANPLHALHLLPVIARLLFISGQAGSAAQFCSMVIHHPQAESGLQREAQALLSELPAAHAASQDIGLESCEPILPTWQMLLAVLHD
jgi:tetratricopeptide (TPR) repeat protein